ncbi:anthranilate phosphoribosyltransferase [Novosphingobium sp. AAP93]|uniref:anthranilate phosphoribosyltransferase n=1 Tax=Novosphingobium sp. AAP93 TaxID=1523427 RepID=UPI0006B93CA2|nr:anthranilate phosphoribosyltransferase [Novosphingobium sp. AAP93]KPF88828.1 anthranilate phosphoribosyltransferase [Novosphingobium sp. AAP93]
MKALPEVTAAPLEEAEAEAAFAAILDGTVPEESIAPFLVALAERGETASEIAGAARAMRARMIPISAPAHAIDVCGTGGDGQHSLNVSTAVSLVVAACGVPVAKHGNRAASSKAGAADTLEALGLNLDRAAETAELTLGDLGICFLFAQRHHPALARIAPIRKALGRRTIFNLLGPLCNPARVKRQLVGVASTEIVEPYADALKALGSERFMVVNGNMNKSARARWVGIDEISISGGTVIIEYPASGDQSHKPEGWEKNYSFICPQPPEVGLPFHRAAAIRGGDAAFNAAALRALLQGEPSAYRDAVLFNAAAALMVAGEAGDWHEGVEEAAEAIDKGLANALLNCWIAAIR